MRFDQKIFDRAPISVWLRWLRAKKLKMSDINFHGADFCHANFRYANFCYANFRGSDFSDADFSGANFYDVDFHGADFRGAHLNGADFRGAHFRGSDFSDADFCYANFHGADFRGAHLSDADFRGAHLSDADFSGADFSGADFCYAHFRGSDFSVADFYGSDFSGTALCMQCPSEGSFIGWKKVAGKIVKLQITESAKRSSATTHKCRCSEALVLEIDDGAMQQITNNSYAPLTYKVGELVHPDSFDDDRWNECTHGIHFFISRHDAEKH